MGLNNKHNKKPKMVLTRNEFFSLWKIAPAWKTFYNL